MSDLLTFDKIYLILLFILPGFISTKIWSMLIAKDEVSAKEIFLDLICYSLLNFAFFSWAVYLSIKSDNIYSKIVSILFLTIITPSLWPFLFKKFSDSNFYNKFFLNNHATSWDFFFSQQPECFLLIHLKSKEMIGGLYLNGACSSTYPKPKDLYLSEVWELSEKGEFVKPIEDSMGLLIEYSEIEYIELFKVEQEDT